MQKVNVEIMRVQGADDLPLPKYMSEGAAGVDLPAAVRDEIEVQPGEIVKVPTGFAVSIPIGYEAQVRPRSGLAIRNGISLVNSPGTIDSDYRGEICVILINMGKVGFTIQRGDRIAQMVIAPVARAEFQEVKTLSETTRGEGGFGHTGLQ